MRRIPLSGLCRLALATLLWLVPTTTLLTAIGLWESGRASAATCPSVANTPFFTFAYGPVQLDGSPAPAGTVVEARSPRDDVVGCFEVTTSGSYGAMYIYGEDSSVSPAIPGMRDGETVVFRVDGVVSDASPQLDWHNDRDLHLVDLDAQTLLPLAAPSNLGASATAPTEISLTWQDNSTDESAFYVERSADGGASWAAAGATGPDETGYSDQGLAYLLQEWYIRRSRKLRASHPRDLCDQIIDIANYRNISPEMSPEMIDRAAGAYFVDL